MQNLKRKYSIKKENILGHSDISPLRKYDPWRKISLEKT
jgi:N-acetyl-anhydromuramyl-L-alanine amidase AmpD